jgi:hypothetical protein
MPAAVGDRGARKPIRPILGFRNSAEHRRVEIVVYEALKKLAKRGTVRQDGTGPKAARFLISVI